MLNSAMIPIIERFNPAIGYPTKGGFVGDFFAREALTPTGWPTMYTEAVVGTGSGAMNAGGAYILTTSAAIGDDVDLRLSGMIFFRRSPITGGAIRSLQGILDYWTLFSMTSAATIESFIGLIGESSSALTGLPSTVRHMGIRFDDSADANFILTSADGSTNITTDTTIIKDVAIHCLHIRWDGAESALIELLNPTNFTRQGTAQTVAALSTNGFTAHWFAQTEALAAKTTDVLSWMARIS